MFVKPAPRLVRDPRTGVFLDPAVGTVVDDNDINFAQLLNHGDVVRCAEDGSDLPPLADDPAAPSPAAAEPTPAAKPVPAPAATKAPDAPAGDAGKPS